MRPGTIRRLLHPALNPGGYMAAAGAIYAAIVMIVSAANHHGVVSVPVIVAAVAAVASLLGRHVVTPVADPRAADGTQLIPVTQVATFRGPAAEPGGLNS
jgi:hypothetical protein